MAIENRDLQPGTRLVATYKGQHHVSTVGTGEDAKLVFALEDGRTFKSPSAAGSAVMGGLACNGWRFWTPEGSEPEALGRESKSRAAKAQTKAKPIIRRTPNQKGVPEGQARWFCDGCMKSFLAPTAA